MLEFRIGYFARNIRRVLQTGDLHLQGKMLEQQVPVLDWIVQTADEREVDLVCITGDIAGWHVPHRATDAERNAFALFVFQLAAFADVVITMGNHDVAENWQWLAEGDTSYHNRVMGRVHFVDRPTALVFNDFRLQCMSYPAKHWVGTGADGEGDLRSAVTAATAELGSRVKPGERVFYTGHHGTIGCVFDGGRPAPAVDAENFTPEQVLATGCEAAGFNHIHIPQLALREGKTHRGWHVGAPYHLTFGDQGERGISVWEFSGTDEVTHEFIESPSKPWVTATGRWNGNGWDMDTEVPTTGKVRLRLSWRDGDDVDVAAALAMAGPDAKVETTVERHGVTPVTWDATATIIEQFAAWCRNNKGREPTDNELEAATKAAAEVES